MRSAPAVDHRQRDVDGARRVAIAAAVGEANPA